MNSIQKEISVFLSSISPAYAPIKDECKQYLKYCSIIDGDSSSEEKGNTLSFLECMCIIHNPCLLKDYYTFTLNKGIDPSWLIKFYENTNQQVPKLYTDFSLEINGCNFFNSILEGFTLFGLPHSRYYREGRKPYMVQEGIKHLNINERNSSGYYFNQYNGFCIGNHSVDFQGVYIGYFIADNKIISASNGGKIKNEHDNFTELLKL